MKSVLYVYIFLATVLISCSNSKDLVHEQYFIVGEWIIHEANFKGTLDDMKPQEDLDFYTFFGSSIWGKAVGETFEFRDDGTWNSSMVPKEVIDIVELKYEFNKNITINVFGLQDSTVFEFEVIVDELESNLMVWKFGNYMDVKLQRKE